MSNTDINISAPTLPSGSGTLRGIGETFQSATFTGTATLSIPIPTSPCRGFEPTLALKYSSGTGNGLFGLGFALTIPNIPRKTEKGAPRYDGSDTFLLANANDLVPALALHKGVWSADEITLAGGADGAKSSHIRRFRPRTEGLFAAIEAHTRMEDGDLHWQVTDRHNATNVYGRSEQARVADPADPQRGSISGCSKRVRMPGEIALSTNICPRTTGR